MMYGKTKSLTAIMLHSVLLALTSLAIMGCNKPIDQEILGKWNPEEGKGAFYFFPDNTFLIQGGSQTTGTWLKVGDDRFKLDAKSGNLTGVIVLENIKIYGDQMNFTRDEIDYTFTRER